MREFEEGIVEKELWNALVESTGWKVIVGEGLLEWQEQWKAIEECWMHLNW